MINTCIHFFKKVYKAAGKASLSTILKHSGYLSKHYEEGEESIFLAFLGLDLAFKSKNMSESEVELSTTLFLFLRFLHKESDESESESKYITLLDLDFFLCLLFLFFLFLCFLFLLECLVFDTARPSPLRPLCREDTESCEESLLRWWSGYQLSLEELSVLLVEGGVPMLSVALVLLLDVSELLD